MGNSIDVSTGISNQLNTPLRENNTRLSVIIACRNGAKTLAVQLDALAAQQWDKPWEVIVVDNGSTDESVFIAQQYQNRISQLRIIDASEKKGQPYALNVGARAARGEFLAFCDADDEVAPGWIAAMGNALSRYEFVAGAWDIIKLNDPWVSAAHKNSQKDGLMKQPGYYPYAGSGNMGVRRSTFESIGGFDESLLYVFDTDFCWRMGLAGVTLHFVPDALLYVRFRSDFRSAFRQAYNWARTKTWLERRYQVPGSDQTVSKRIRTTGVQLLKRGLRVRNKTDLFRWVYRFGWFTGQVRGTLLALPSTQGNPDQRTRMLSDVKSDK